MIGWSLETGPGGVLSSHDSAETATLMDWVPGAPGAPADGDCVGEAEGLGDAVGESVAEVVGAGGGSDESDELLAQPVSTVSRTGNVTARGARRTVIISVKRGAGVQGLTLGQTNS
jgi:hypothetical protein